MSGQFYDVAAFLDAGFLIAEGARTLRARRRTVSPNASAIVDWLRQLLGPDELPGGNMARLLRVYWYDGAFDPRDSRYRSQRSYHDAIAATPGVRLRLGHIHEVKPSWHHALTKALEKCGVDVNEFRQHFEMRSELRQKGVDTRITMDLVRLAQRGVMDSAILIAGDRDLAEPVREAQEQGCFVTLAAPAGAGVAAELRQLVDASIELDQKDLRKLLRVS